MIDGRFGDNGADFRFSGDIDARFTSPGIDTRFLHGEDTRFGHLPLTLFADGAPGLSLDPSDRSTLFQDAAGTTPANSPGDPVALVLDKSEGLVLGPELVTNGSFDTDTDWGKGTGWTISGGTASCDGTQVANTNLYDAAAGIEDGKTYRIEYEVSGYVSGTLKSVPNGNTGGVVRSANGVYSEIVTAKPGGDTVFYIQGNASFVGSIDNISVRELPGHHAFQDTNNDFRPTLARHPATGLRNLLNVSEDFSAWSAANGTVTANQTIAPDGTMSGDNFTVDGVYGILKQLVPVSPGATYTFSFWARNVDATSASYRAYDMTNAADIVGGTGYFSQISSGAWTRVEFSFTAPAGCTSAAVYVASVDQGGTVSFWGAQLEEGSAATAYQKRVDQYDVTEAGQRDLWYLDFDGIDDFFETPAIDFTGTDKMSVFAGVHKASDAAVGTVMELSNSDLNSGMFFLRAPATGLNEYQFKSRGTLNGFASGLASAPTTGVVTGLMEISVDLMKMRLDGVEVASGAADQGTGNFGNYPLYIGARAGTSLFFNGRLYGLAIVGKQTTDAEIANTERYLAGKSGVTL